MSRFEDRIDIDAPIDRVWEIAADPRNVSLIDPRATIELVTGDWTDVGSKHRVTEKVGGRAVESLHEITRREPPTFQEERMQMSGVMIVASVELSAISPVRTRLVTRIEVDWGSGIRAWVGRFFAQLAGAARRRRLARLKDVIESRTANEETHLREEG